MSLLSKAPSGPSHPPAPQEAPSPSVCAGCAGCCTCDPRQVNLIAPLSLREYQEMTTRFPLAKELIASSPNTPRFIADMHNMFKSQSEKVQLAFPPGKEHYHMGIDPQGNCLALGPRGCIIPRESRPLICRLYPLWYDEGKLQVFNDPSCAALKKAPSTGRLIAMLGTSRKEVQALFKLLLLVWGFKD